ncbi:glycosyltransferase [Corallincola luteus]|uniref:Glycosyltransferase n=1 Tax=Corallincola luteus TaxID=1775177 RepID=A0ABY2AJ74_9GAMM|nr:glycosyltransferase [Corallincola luteus]
MKLSVIIPSYQSQDNLGRNLAAQTDQLKNVDAEIIVVDCSPTDEVDQICAAFDGVRLIKVAERFNPGGGRNIGAQHANGDYLVFVDADVVLKHDALENIAKHACSSEAGSQMFGGALDLDMQSDPNLSSYIEHYYFNHESQSSRTPSIRSNLSSALMIVEKKLFDSVGGFSDIPRMQDTELTERLASDGIQLGFFPDVVGYQIQDSPLKKVFRKIYITGNNLFFLRYGSRDSFLKKLVLALLLPLMMLAKITRINIRNLRYAASLRMIFVLCPLMYACGFTWMLGFYKALFAGDGIASGR